MPLVNQGSDMKNRISASDRGSRGFRIEKITYLTLNIGSEKGGISYEIFNTHALG